MNPKVFVWIWTIEACEGGDLDAIVRKAQEHGVGVLVKTADGLARSGLWDHSGRSLELVAKLVAAGVPVRTWSYIYPTVEIAGQVELALRSGVGHIFDAEVEWDDHATEARLFVNYALVRRQPGQLLGYAPLPVVSYHDRAGQYEEFNRLDVACPQAYAGTGGREAVSVLQWTEDEWAKAFPGCRLEPAVYAADQTGAQLRDALAYCFGKLASHDRIFGDGSVSVWSWQHISDEQWAVIDEFKEGSVVSREEFTAYQKNVFDSMEAHVAAIGDLTNRLKKLENDDTVDDAVVQGLKDRLDKLRAAVI